MGRGGKEGSGQKTRGERQQLSLWEILITSITDEETEAQKFQGLAGPTSVRAAHCPSSQRS